MICEDIIIIGAGPAGIAAGVQIKRSGLDPLMIEKCKVGGLLKNANRIENYPGFPGGISGAELVRRFQRHLDQLSIRIRRENVISLERIRDKMRVVTEENSYKAKIVLVATGTRGKQPPDLGIPEKEAGIRVFDEIHPILPVRNKRIVIVGAGDAAFDYALTLAVKNDVFIFNRGTKTRCLPLLSRQAARVPRIFYKENSRILRAVRHDEAGIELDCRSSEKYWRLTVDYVIFAIGREANLGFIPPGLKKNIGNLEEKGRFFLAGDVRNGRFRQAVIAAGEGTLAGMKIAAALGEREHEDC